jgi:hypothetical protein
MIGENCTVLELRGPGAKDGYGQVADGATGALIWSGRAPATMRTVRRSKKEEAQSGGSASGERTTRIEVDQLIIRRLAGVSIDSIVVGEQAKGTTVLVEDRRTGTTVTKRRRVVGVDNRAAGTNVDAIRLDLADER